MRSLFVLLGMWLALALVVPTHVVAQDATPTVEPVLAEVATGLARTDQRYFLPFTRDGLNPGLSVTGNERGVCGFTSAAALARPDAWDCIGDTNQIHDPCFENPFALDDDPGELACITSPFTTEVILFTLKDPLVRDKEVAAVNGTGPNAAM